MCKIFSEYRVGPEKYNRIPWIASFRNSQECTAVLTEDGKHGSSCAKFRRNFYTKEIPCRTCRTSSATDLKMVRRVLDTESWTSHVYEKTTTLTNTPPFQPRLVKMGFLSSSLADLTFDRLSTHRKLQRIKILLKKMWIFPSDWSTIADKLVLFNNCKMLRKKANF
jgi:hypothetical protein